MLCVLFFWICLFFCWFCLFICFCVLELLLFSFCFFICCLFDLFFMFFLLLLFHLCVFLVFFIFGFVFVFLLFNIVLVVVFVICMFFIWKNHQSSLRGFLKSRDARLANTLNVNVQAPFSSKHASTNDWVSAPLSKAFEKGLKRDHTTLHGTNEHSFIVPVVDHRLIL